MSGGDLPPSPPWTESTLGPPPQTSNLHNQTPLDSPPDSPKQQRNPISPPSVSLSPSPPSTIPASPLPPLSAEAFFNVLTFIPQRGRPNLGLVSRAWYAFLANEPRLWPELRVDLHHDQSDYVDLWTDRAGHGQAVQGAGVRSLIVTLGHQRTSRELYGDIVSKGVVAQRFSHLVRILNDDGIDDDDEDGPALERLEVMATASTTATCALLQAICLYAGQEWAYNIKTLKVNAWIRDVWVSESVLALWPKLEESDLTFYSNKYAALAAPPRDWDFGTPSTEAPTITILEKLKTIRWNSLAVPHTIDIPFLPALKTLSLHNVIWEGYSVLLLIRLARYSLEEISIVDLEMIQVESGGPMDDYDRSVLVEDPLLLDHPPLHPVDPNNSLSNDPWEAVPLLFLPKLKKLTVVGSGTPPLFGSLEALDSAEDVMDFATGPWMMPALEEASLRNLELDSTYMPGPAVAPLKLFGQYTTQLRSLNLSSTSCTPLDIYNALQSGTAIRSLCLFDTAVTDQLIAHLPALTPCLAELDVRLCAKVNITSVARVVEAIRDRSEGQYRLERVWADEPDWGHAEFAAVSWLLWHDIWVREKSDFEGLGPGEVKARRKWVREGKADAGKEEREAKWRERELEEQMRRLREENEREWAETKREAKAWREARDGEEWAGCEEVHYRTGSDEWGMVALVERYDYQAGAVGVTSEGERMEVEEVESTEASSDSTLRSASPTPAPPAVGEVDELRTPALQQVVPMRDRPSSAMSLIEHAG